MKKRNTGELEKAISRPLRPRVIRPKPFVGADGETIERENALMEELHEKAVAEAREAKLKLLLRRYSLTKGDWHGLALALANDHEPGFKIDRQIAELPPGFCGPVLVKGGQIIHKQTGRPVQWSVERLDCLLDAVEGEKKKTGLTKDIDVLPRLAKRKEWGPPPKHRSNSSRGEYNAWVRTLQSRLHDAKRLKRAVESYNAEIENIQRKLANNSGNY